MDTSCPFWCWCMPFGLTWSLDWRQHFGLANVFDQDFWHGPSKSWKNHPIQYGGWLPSPKPRPFKSRVDREVLVKPSSREFCMILRQWRSKMHFKVLMFPKVCEFGSQGAKGSLYSRWRSHLWVVVAPPNFNSWPFAKVSHVKREGTSFNHHVVGEKKLHWIFI